MKTIKCRLVINDENFDLFCDPGDCRCGTIARNYAQVPYGSIPSIPPGSDIEEIDLEEWPDLIADQDRSESSLYHIWKDSKIGILNQSSISYCHAFADVFHSMLVREMQQLEYVELSASSIGGPVTGWKNAGAYIHDDLLQSYNFGACSTDFCPMLTTNLRDCKPGWKENALLHRTSEYIDVPARDFKKHGSLLLRNKPVNVGLNYWGHAVADLKVIDLYPQRKATDWLRYGFMFANSWSTQWGDEGFGVRHGNKALADAIYTRLQVKLIKSTLQAALAT